MMRISWLSVQVALAVLCSVATSWAQDAQTDALKREVEQRFDVLPLRQGLALHPKTARNGVRAIEIEDGTIALDGQPATGAELRSRLGADADTILRLSYLSDAARRQMFGQNPPSGSGSTAPGTSTPTSPAIPSVPQPPAVVEPPTPPSPPDPPRIERRSRGERRSGDRVRVGGSLDVEPGEVVFGDVVAVGGSVNVDGEVRGDVVAVGGSIVLGPQASVEQNVTAVGGSIKRDPAARIGGKSQVVDIPGLDIGNWNWRVNPVGYWWGNMVGSAFAFVGTVARVAVLCLLAALVVLFGREYMERAGAVAAAEPVKAGAVGLLAQILFVPLLVVTCVVLVVTIIGIPLLLLLPFVILGLIVFGVVGFAGVAHRLGGIAAARFGLDQTNPYVVTLIGVAVVMLPVLLSRLVSLGGGVLFPLAITLAIVGGLLEYVAWTVGFGSVLLLRFRRYGASRTGMSSGPTGDNGGFTSSPLPSAS